MFTVNTVVTMTNDPLKCSCHALELTHASARAKATKLAHRTHAHTQTPTRESSTKARCSTTLAHLAAPRLIPSSHTENTRNIFLDASAVHHSLQHVVRVHKSERPVACVVRSSPPPIVHTPTIHPSSPPIPHPANAPQPASRPAVTFRAVFGVCVCM